MHIEEENGSEEKSPVGNENNGGHAMKRGNEDFNNLSGPMQMEMGPMQIDTPDYNLLAAGGSNQRKPSKKLDLMLLPEEQKELISP